jgi:Protein of unknown function (DUF1676)
LSRKCYKFLRVCFIFLKKDQDHTLSKLLILLSNHILPLTNQSKATFSYALVQFTVKKAGKLLGPLLIGILLKAALLAPLVLGAIALIAGKALIIGKIALLLSAVIGLKKLLSGHQKAVTYEVVSHPHSYSSHDTYSAGSSSGGAIAASSPGSYSGSSSSGWGRSIDAHQMAYAKQAP